MAQIIIREKDLTGNAAQTVFDIAVVPGLVNEATKGENWSTDYIGKPLYFTTLSAFQSVIGLRPVQFDDDDLGIPYTKDNDGNITCPAPTNTTKTNIAGYFFAGGTGTSESLDPGYIYAAELLTAGIPIYYLPIWGTKALDVYNALGNTIMTFTFTENSFSYTSVNKPQNGPITYMQKSALLQLVDRGTYNIKYLTSGGYPTYEFDSNTIAKLMLQVAGANNNETDDYNDDPTSNNPNGRGDCVAFIDHFEVDDRPLLEEGSVYARLNGSDAYSFVGQPFLSYGTMFTPYANYKLSKTYLINIEDVGDQLRSTMYLPGSFAYLTCLAKQLNGPIPSYEAIAGVGKGSVSNIVFNNVTNSYETCTKETLTNYIANYYNNPMSPDEGVGRGAISINAITQINPYGMVIYGTRTLAEKSKVYGVKATGVLNIRNMVSDIKKQMYQTARRYMFSANNDALWINFRNGVVGLLNEMRSGYGIKSYTLSKDTERSTKSSLYVLCSIVPVYPVEKFDITIEITDEEIEVNETTQASNGANP